VKGLQIVDLNAWYGRAQILFKVALNVNEGEVVVLVGRNGAGKTTTLKAIMNLLQRVGGSRHFDGRSIAEIGTSAICRMGLGYVPEDRRIFGGLTVMENLYVGQQPRRHGAPHWTVERLFEIFPNLGRMRNRLGSQMSGGEQQMLTVARTLMGNPRLILLDEPSEGLAPVIVQQMAAAVREMKREGLAILLSEQNLHFAKAVADRAYVMEKGHLRFQGTLESLFTDETARNAYLTV
jgi:branched-chain amino acid transport system ATP-binding protein